MPNNHILAQNLYYNYYYPKTKYPTIGYVDPLGNRNIRESKRVKGLRSKLSPKEVKGGQ